MLIAQARETRARLCVREACAERLGQRLNVSRRDQQRGLVRRPRAARRCWRPPRACRRPSPPASECQSPHTATGKQRHPPRNTGRAGRPRRHSPACRPRPASPGSRSPGRSARTASPGPPPITQAVRQLCALCSVGERRESAAHSSCAAAACPGSEYRVHRDAIACEGRPRTSADVVCAENAVSTAG